MLQLLSGYVAFHCLAFKVFYYCYRITVLDRQYQAVHPVFVRIVRTVRTVRTVNYTLLHYDYYPPFRRHPNLTYFSLRPLLHVSCLSPLAFLIMLYDPGIIYQERFSATRNVRK